MLVPVSAFYAVLTGLVGLVLMFFVGRQRGLTGVSLSNSGEKGLVEADRRHMNWVENVPFILLLIAMAELNGAPKLWLHALGIVLLLSRIIHPFGISTLRMNHPAREVGAGGTFLVTVAAMITLLWQLATH